MHWKQFWTLTSGRDARLSAQGVYVRREDLFRSARMTNEDNWSSQWRFGRLHSELAKRAIRPAGCYESSGGPTSLRKRTKRLTSHRSPTRPPHAGRGPTSHSPLMAGRRRRTPAAALRWRRCRCRCRSSSRSTCAGIECHSSPPRSTRCRPRVRLCSMAWNFRKGPRTDFQEIMFEFHTVVRYKSRPPVGASGSNSIFGAV